jgi:hypothetical protein
MLVPLILRTELQYLRMPRGYLCVHLRYSHARRYSTCTLRYSVRTRDMDIFIVTFACTCVIQQRSVTRQSGHRWLYH